MREFSCINGWGNCGPVKPQKDSQNLYAVTNSMMLINLWKNRKDRRRCFEVNEFLMTLEFSQGICSLTPILSFQMWDPEIDKASSYGFFFFFFLLSSLLVQVDGITSKWFSSYLFHTVDDNTWRFKTYWWLQPNKAIKFLIGNVSYSH